MSGNLRLIAAPSIYLVGRTRCESDDLEAFLIDSGSPEWTSGAPSGAEKLVEVAGRVCYMSFKAPRPGGNSTYISHILEAGHGSVTEHAVYNFIITGVSRSLTHELIRHRAGFGFSELSQRFVDESSTAFVIPPAMLCYREASARRAEVDAHNEECYAAKEWGNARPHDQTDGETAARWHRWMGCLESCLETYRDQVWCFENHHPVISRIGEKTAKRKAAREAARSVLPNATETKIFVTGNSRSLRNVFEQRGSLSADAEIRRLAVAWCKIMKSTAPNLFNDFSVETDAVTESEYLTFTYRKV